MVAQKWLQKNEKLLLVTLWCGLLSLPICLGTNENDGQRLRRSATANFGKRITSSLVAELGKRPKDMYAFGIGKRSISDDELEEILAENKMNIKNPVRSTKGIPTHLG